MITHAIKVILAITTAGALLAMPCFALYLFVGYKPALALWLVLMFTNIWSMMKKLSKGEIKL